MDLSDHDPRLTRTDHRLVEQMEASAPRAMPSGLIDRVLSATLPLLAESRNRDAHRLHWPIVVGRMAVAAGLCLAIVLGFWTTPGPRTQHDLLLPLAADPGERPSGSVLASGPFTWRDGPMLTLLAVKDINYDGALGDLETVVHSVGAGQTNMLGLVGDDGPLDRVESELLTVTTMAGGNS